MQRERVSHPLIVRHLTVSAREDLSDTMVRITLRGSELAGFVSSGPGDHMKVFFPDPESGVFNAPYMTEDGRHTPEGVIISRDYTPRQFRPSGAGGPELDIDFVLHGAAGPATYFAAHAKVGDPLAVAGPRGSALPPSGAASAILIADESALPALSRWVRELPDECKSIRAFIEVGDAGLHGYLDGFERDGLEVTWFTRGAAPDQTLTALQGLGALSDDTYIWAAGETTSLIGIRRYLRRELGLPKEQVSVDGYWKAGIVNRDHHAPIDPSDPD